MHLAKIGNESPILINPRFEDPEPYFTYDTSKAHSPGKVFIGPSMEDAAKTSRAINSIMIADLNRVARVNISSLKDTLTSDRALVFIGLQEAVREMRDIEKALKKTRDVYATTAAQQLLTAMTSFEEALELATAKITSYSKHTSEFAGMCRQYLRSEGLPNLIEN